MLKRISFLLVSAVTLTAFEATVDYSDPMVDRLLAIEQSLEQADEPCIISQYDAVMRKVASEQGHDWRLMSAIAYHESRFSPDIVSKRGAAGLMQIMPAVARRYNITGDRLFDPETNVRLAARLLSEIDAGLRLAPGTSADDRMRIVLASYNGGIGHVSDARRLARSHGENPNSWEVVSRYLELKADPAYYENEVVRCGRFTGYKQTRAYVNDVMKRYDRYCQVAK